MQNRQTQGRKPGSSWGLVAVMGWLLAGWGPAARAAEAPVELTDQHVDLRVLYDPAGTNTLDVVAVDEDSHPPRVLAATRCVLVAAEHARLELPADLPPLGNAGDPLWVLPSSQQTGLLYLGVSGEGIPSGVFAEPIRLRLVALEGPGHFFLWQAELGGLEFSMNTRDGIGEADVFSQAVGGHSHADWGFTTSGVYRVTFQAESRRVGESTNLVSEPRTFEFHVLPLPPTPPSPFREWQERHWPGVTDPAIIGEGADPDGDTQVNLWEYALGSDPQSPAPPPVRVPSLSLVGEDRSLQAVLRADRVASATDLEYRVWTAETPGGPWVASELTPDVSAPADGWVIFRFTDPRPVATRLQTYYRVEARLRSEP